LLPKDTAYVTDIGMTGPIDSIIGDDVEPILQRFLTAIPHHLTVGRGKTVFNAVMVKVDDESGKAIKIDRISEEV
jgi:hypothetical protein